MALVLIARAHKTLSNSHADVFRGIRGHKFVSYFVYDSNEGSGESVYFA